MAAAPIPGSYPDSVPATPDETQQQLVQSEQRHHRQRNKLHKPGDPRGHKYTDSGVGITDPEPILSSRPPEPTWKPQEEAVGGGRHSWEYAQPIQRLDSIRTGVDDDTAKAQQDSAVNEAWRRGSGDRHLDLGTSTAVGMAENTRSEDIESSRAEEPSRDSAPYWGSLPKGAYGGVYNRVTGHGSPTDDHSVHHQLPAKSTSQRSVIIGNIADHPRGGGVYNTVTGHGSQDDESRRHSKRRSADGAGGMAAVAAGPPDDVLAAPLPDIPEERQRTGPQATFPDTPDIAPGFVPETAVRDDVLLAEAASRDAAGTKVQAANEPQMAESDSHRAFPLMETGPHSRHGKSPSESPTLHEARAAAADLGAGAAASEHVDKHKSMSPAVDEARGSRTRSESNGHQTAGVATGKRRLSRHRSPVEKAKSHEQDSPKTEKKHKVLGIFSRHKDSGHEGTTGSRKKSINGHSEAARDDDAALGLSSHPRKQSRDEAPSERKASPSSAPRAEAGGHDGHGKENGAAGAAAGAGIFSLLHRKRHSVSEKPYAAARRVSGPLTADAGGAGPAEEAPRQVERVSTPFEHPREPPMPPDAGGQTGNYDVLASGTSSGIKPSTSSAVDNTTGITTNEPTKYNTLASGTPSGINATVAAGASSKDTAARESGHHHGLRSSGGSATEAARRDVVHQEPGDYNVLVSSGTPPAEKQASSQGSKASGAVVTQEPGHYNMLDSGVPSGIERHSAVFTGHRQYDTATASSEDGDDSVKYNTLSSGTPSGVKVKPKSPGRTTNSAVHTGDQNSQEQYNTLSSSTASGINPETRHYQPQERTTSCAEQLRDLPAPANQYASPAAPIPSHPQQVSEPNPDQEPLPGITTYPRPELVQNMSPEVMPSAYTASAFRASSGPSHAQAQTQGPNQAKNMSPEVMPSAYTASAPRQSAPAPAPAATQLKQVPHKEKKETGKGVDPALAAATTSWATSAGKSSGVTAAGPSLGQAPGQGRLVHRCLHCGRDNDITGYFAQFGPRAV